MLSRFSRNVGAAMSSYSQNFTNKLFTTISVSSSVTANTGRLLNLNDMGVIPGSMKKRRRWGRGIGSNRGKTSGHGHQKSRSTPRGFEGGQTPLYKRLPKIGFHNHGERDLQILNLDTIHQFIVMGRLVPKPNTFITLRDLLECGIISQLKDGVKILSKGRSTLKSAIHLEVSSASKQSIAAVEAMGGTITCIHLNKLALRAITKPYKFDILPRRARPVPRLMGSYLDYSRGGYLSPEIQIRNLKLFGTVTSEEGYRAEHDRFMVTKRKLLWPKGQPEYRPMDSKVANKNAEAKDAMFNL